MLGTMRFIRRLVILANLLISLCFVLIFDIIHFSLGTAYFYLPYHHTPSPQIVPSALLSLTPQGDTSSTNPLVTGGTMKGFYFHWLTNLKFSENKLKFAWDKMPTT